VHRFEAFSKTIIEGQEVWKELIRLLSVEGQPTKEVLAQTCVGVVFIRSVSDTISVMLLLQKPPANGCRPPVVGGPQFEKHC
jgi:hypothetical protein